MLSFIFISVVITAIIATFVAVFIMMYTEKLEDKHGFYFIRYNKKRKDLKKRDVVVYRNSTWVVIDGNPLQIRLLKPDVGTILVTNDHYKSHSLKVIGHLPLKLAQIQKIRA